ncbi:MAG: hypothetical protein Q7R40_09945 [Phaeospirillum sp.]|nr:hypothetical protein [Phaeospirillum sp.]
MSTKLHHTLLKLWHAWVAGAFLVAYVTADEDTYAMHLFAGYAVLAAIVVRLLVGAFAPTASPLRLPRPTLDWARKGRHPLFGWLAAALLAGVGLAAISGALADGLPWLEDPHEVIAQTSLWVIGGHVAFVAFIYGGKRLLNRIGQELSGIRFSKENIQ